MINQSQYNIDSILESYVKSNFTEDSWAKKIRFYKMIWNQDAELFNNNSTVISEEKIYSLVKDDHSFIGKVNEFFNNNKIDDYSNDIDLLCDYFKLMFNYIFDVQENYETPSALDDETANTIDFSLLKSSIREDNIYKTYALCHHCYPMVRVIPYNYVLTGDCQRSEKYTNEFRKEKFKMIELVLFNSQKNLNDSKLKLLYLLTRIGHMVSNDDFYLTVANDSFVSDNSELLMFQFLNKAKIELQIYSKKYNELISISSINMHNQFFSKKFDIKDRDDKLANSMCIGIGIDRVFGFLKK